MTNLKTKSRKKHHIKYYFTMNGKVHIHRQCGETDLAAVRATPEQLRRARNSLGTIEWPALVCVCARRELGKR